MENQSKSLLEKLSEKKALIELAAAALTIPVLLTVILLNFNDIKGRNNNPTTSNNNPIIIEKENGNQDPAQNLNNKTSEIATPNPETCNKQIGPINISSPSENATISENPVNFIIKHSDTNYCSVVWSYRINSGAWSEFSSNSPTIFNMPSGSIKFELRIQSTVSNDQELLIRNFTYESNQLYSSPSPLAE